MTTRGGRLLNEPIDVSADFRGLANTYFLPATLDHWDARAARGAVRCRRHLYTVRTAFNQSGQTFTPAEPYEFPPEYGDGTSIHPFALSFHGPRVVRLRLAGGKTLPPLRPSPMLARLRATPRAWAVSHAAGATTYRSSAGSVAVLENPWRIELRDAGGRLLTSTVHLDDSRCLQNASALPFCVVRRAADCRRRVAASFALSPAEKLFGGGESFTRLDKRGQKLVLCTSDAYGVQTREQYKPIPFLLSSRGYGLFLHTTTPATFDLGHSYDSVATLFTGDDDLDLFLLLGEPKDVLSAYTGLTGRSPRPPLWSFGLWMSRCTYKSEAETRAVAARLRANRIPCDVLHLDTGWFENDWRCDYAFSRTRFANPRRLLRDLRRQGFRVSLWQLPYFTPTNRLFGEVVARKLAVTDGRGGLPTEDAVLDFSNPRAVAWYQDHLARLLKLGVAAIKVDFGEAAPLHGHYASGRTGFHEHNLYPLRYTRAVAAVSARITGERLVWARSAWAGCQRYPIHWGGDAENTDGAMAATLRAGLSLGLCGFAFWSHDIGGFVRHCPEDLYERWLAFGLLTSHSRCHGLAPKEPWNYGRRFVGRFRRIVELKYRLLPYVYAQAAACARSGLPMLRPLFVEYPDDPTAWLVEDAYLFGRDLLVAPLLEADRARNVYLPAGEWVDFQTGAVVAGGAWRRLEAGPIPCIVLARGGAAIPHAAVSQATPFLDWSHLDLRTYGRGPHTGLLCLPTDRAPRVLTVHEDGRVFGRLPARVRLTVKGPAR